MILWLKFEGDKFFPCFNFEINKKKIWMQEINTLSGAPWWLSH